MKGILLSGGKGTRLYPLTHGVSKQLLPVYDKPMIYYSLSVLLLAGIRDILLITTPQDQSAFQRVLGDGSQWGIRLQYVIQPEPRGIADAFLLGEAFIGGEPVCLILGDNIFYGQGFFQILQRAAQLKTGAQVFAYRVRDPERYGVIELDDAGKPLSIEEKPKIPKSRLAVTGLYFYGPEVVDLTKNLKPSGRGELEITDVNREFLKRENLKAERLTRGFAWLDTGTTEALHLAANFVQAVQERQGTMIACPEEIAFRMGYITKQDLLKLAALHQSTEYGRYLFELSEEGTEGYGH